MKLFLKQYGLLIGGLIVLFFVYGFHEILFLRPQSMHQWRQTDCLQIAHNYLTDSWNFFSPSIHNLFSDNETTGKTIGEFPLLYYLVAFLWKVFGEHEFIYRLVSLLVFYLGLLALFNTLKNLYKDIFWASLVVLFLFTSPILIFYSNNFLTNAPAFGLVLIGWSFFYRFYKSKKNKLLYLSILFFTLAGLLKMTAYISFILLGCFWLYDLLRVLVKNDAIIFNKLIKSAAPFFFSLTTIFIWYLYGSFFNLNHGGKYTFNGLWPIWEMQEGHMAKIEEFVRDILIHQIFSKYSLVLIVIMAIYLLVKFKTINKFIVASILILTIGTTLYLLFWFQALDAHDYYVINLMVLPLFIVVSFFWHLKETYPSALKNKSLKIIGSIVLLYNIFYASNNIHMRYWGPFNYSDKYPKYFCDKNEIDFWWWTGSQNPLEALNDIEDYNRKLGIKQNDIVAFIPDQSFGVSLYLMNQKGWTSGFGIENTPNPRHSIKDKINNKNLSYLFVRDSSSLKNEYLTPYLSNHIGHYNGINIYSLK